MNDQSSPAVYEPSNLPAVQPSADMTAMHFIDRVLRDPSIPMDRLREAFALRKEMRAEYAKAAFDAALSELQPALPSVAKDGKIVVRDKNNSEKIIQSTAFATLDNIIEAVGPVLGKHGFAVRNLVANAPDGKVRVTCVISHRDGHREETFFDVAYDTTGSKNNIQGAGSSIKYMRRYLMCAGLNIATHDDKDDDGNSSPADPAPDGMSFEQIKALEDLAADRKVDVPKFLRLIGRIAKRNEADPFTSLAHIPPAHYTAALALMEQKQAPK